VRIDQIEFEGQSVVVLGAGATRGASFVRERTGPLPPLDADFFTQAQRLSKQPEFLNKLIEDVVTTFGSNFRLTMESYLTRLDQLANVHDDYRFRGRPANNRYRKMRSHFLQVLMAVLNESIGRTPTCEYHSRLIENLNPTDTIISLNYDWLIDHTLKVKGANKWNPKIGYGVPVYERRPRGAGAEYWACQDKNGQPRYPNRSILLLKLHGSMNWFPVPPDRQPPRLQLRRRWWHQRGGLKAEIVPPEWNKPTRSGVYVPVWRRARRSLQEAKALIVIGYSFPETDLPLHALFTVEQNPSVLKLLVTVNPDQRARERIRSVVRRRLGVQTRVLSFEDFRDFSNFLG
jgi:hypothetical protein